MTTTTRMERIRAELNAALDSHAGELERHRGLRQLTIVVRLAEARQRCRVFVRPEYEEPCRGD